MERLDKFLCDWGIGTRSQVKQILKTGAVTVDGNTVTFHCSLKSTDYIEFDGEKAIMYDRLGNPAEVAFTGSVTVPNGEFTATISAVSRSFAPLRASLTFGFEGEEATES